MIWAHYTCNIYIFSAIINLDQWTISGSDRFSIYCLMCTHRILICKWSVVFRCFLWFYGSNLISLPSCTRLFLQYIIKFMLTLPLTRRIDFIFSLFPQFAHFKIYCHHLNVLMRVCAVHSLKKLEPNSNSIFHHFGRRYYFTLSFALFFFYLFTAAVSMSKIVALMNCLIYCFFLSLSFVFVSSIFCQHRMLPSVHNHINAPKIQRLNMYDNCFPI